GSAMSLRDEPIGKFGDVVERAAAMEREAAALRSSPANPPDIPDSSESSTGGGCQACGSEDEHCYAEARGHGKCARHVKANTSNKSKSWNELGVRTELPEDQR